MKPPELWRVLLDKALQDEFVLERARMFELVRRLRTWVERLVAA